MSGIRIGLIVAAGIFTASCVGCGVGDDAPQRYDVVGTVTLRGKPVPAGTIQFIPDAKQGNSGPAGNATISDGKFSTAELGSGVVGKAHYVIINAFDGKANPQAELPMGRPTVIGFRTEHDFPSVEEAPSDKPYEADFEVTK